MEPEDYLNVALTEWLPRRWDDSKYDRALGVLAVRFVEQHGDRWLQDVLAAKRSDEVTRALLVLAEAAEANLADETEDALRKSSEAAQRLRRAGNLPGVLRANVEHIYALHWSADSADDCVAEADSVVHQAEAAGYSWIQGQALIDRGNCRAIVGDSAAAHADLARALELVRKAGYSDLELRASGILSDAQGEAGNVAASWTGARTRLRQYWTGPHPGNRAHQSYFGLARSARSLSLTQTSYRFQNAAVGSIAGTSHRRLEANAWTDLARSAVETARPQEAKWAFERADQLFSLLRPTGTVRRFRALSDLDRAQTEIDAGETRDALRLLEEIQPWVSRLATAHQMDFHGLRAEGLWDIGLPAQAEVAYLQAIRFSERCLGTFQNPSERAQLVTALSRQYRGLVEILWARNDIEGAWRRWEWFRASETSYHRGELNLEQRIKQLRNESFLSYMTIRNGVVVWLFDDRGITGRRLTVERNELDAVASRFLRECADPASDLQAIKRDSRQLYDWLVAPLSDRLDPTRELVVEPDGPVAAVPMQALLDDRFHYLGERFAIAVASGLVDYQQRAEAGLIHADTRALIVANPSLRGDTSKTFPPLRGSVHEGQAVAAAFPETSTLLLAERATIAAMEAHRLNTELLHFAGHGFSNGGNGGLLLSPVAASSEEAGILEGKAIAQQNWHRCRLAVLSACSAGTGEARGPVNPDSLVRGLLWAGVARVVASRWNVDDEDGAFMGQFYSRLLNGSDAAAALQKAAQQAREIKATSHPYYWAGFQTFGTR